MLGGSQTRCYRYVLGLLVLPLCILASEPDIVFLSWLRDPLTTMCVQWIVPENDVKDVLYFRDEASPYDNDWQPVFATRNLLPDRVHVMYWAELENLKPGGSYQFRIGKQGQLRRFRSLPKKASRGVKIGFGGDVFDIDAESLCTEMNRAMAAQNPYFVVMGGDLAYSTDKLGLFGDRPEYWYAWLRLWTKDMVTPEGYTIPLISIIGNHDVLGRYGQTPAQAPYYYALFLWPGQRGYGALDFGDYLTLIGLDSGHTHAIKGAQSAWLEHTLQERRGIKHKVVSYHVPAYSCRISKTRQGRVGPKVLKYWVPLFDRYGVHAAFEHHEHAYKRTHPLRWNRIDPQGTVYLGDGGWGVKTREPDDVKDVWYLARTERANHGIVMSIDDHKRVYHAVNEKGQIFDEWVQIHGLEPAQLINLLE